jgi:voltage-gated sodium channel
MSSTDLKALQSLSGIAPWRLRLASAIESDPAQRFIIGVILVNSIVLGIYIDPSLLPEASGFFKAIDLICLFIFAIELALKLAAYRFAFFRSGWNIFDFLVVAIALVPGQGVLSVLRTLRVLRVLRLLTAVPSLKKVVAAFVHSIPGLGAVVMVMAIFFYAAAVMATGFFGADFPDWFGTIGKSLYTLFQVMTLESWSMGIVRPVMESHPLAWAFFVPFIIIATFTILNLFIGIIVSTMQELSVLPDLDETNRETHEVLERIEQDLATLRKQMKK